jgi:hypothetical protein
MLLCVWLAVGSAQAVDITFQEFGLVHGEVVSDQFFADFGLTISARNDSQGPDKAVIFDSTMRGTPDLDLEFALDGGPLDLFNLLIIQENNDGCDADGICDDPDDEGSRPAGALFFSFETDIVEFGFDLLDIEGPVEMGQVIFRQGGTTGAVIGSIDFEDFVGAVYGNNSANRISPIDLLVEFGAAADTVELSFGGSGAVDNLVITFIPEPTTAGLLGLGLLGLGWRQPFG